jgi:hypothetical protein
MSIGLPPNVNVLPFHSTLATKDYWLKAQIKAFAMGNRTFDKKIIK